MKRIVTGFLLAFYAVGAQAQMPITHSVQKSLSPAATSPKATQPASAGVQQPLPNNEDGSLSIQTDSIIVLQDTTGGQWRVLDLLNQLPNTPNATGTQDPGDSLPISQSVDEFGPITVNGITLNDTLYKRVAVLCDTTPTDIKSPRLDSVAITFFPEAFDTRDSIVIWVIPMVDEQTGNGNSYPFPDIFSSSHGYVPYAIGKIKPSQVTLGQMNTVMVNLGHKVMYAAGKSIYQFGFAAFDDGPGFLNDTIAFQMDFSPAAQGIDTDGSATGYPMRSYFSVLDGGTDFVGTGQTLPSLVSNNEAGFLTGIYTADNNGDFLGNFVMTAYMSGTAVSGVAASTTNGYSLDGNYPNPVSATTDISYNLGVSGPVTLNVYNVLGQNVGTLVNSTQGMRQHSVTFNAGTLPDGMYYYKLQSGEFSATNSMVIAR